MLLVSMSLQIIYSNAVSSFYQIRLTGLVYLPTYSSRVFDLEGGGVVTPMKPW